MSLKHSLGLKKGPKMEIAPATPPPLPRLDFLCTFRLLFLPFFLGGGALITPIYEGPLRRQIKEHLNAALHHDANNHDCNSSNQQNELIPARHLSIDGLETSSL